MSNHQQNPKSIPSSQHFEELAQEHEDVFLLDDKESNQTEFSQCLSKSDVAWVSGIIGRCRTERITNRYLKKAPTSSAMGLLVYASQDMKAFYEKFAYKLLKDTESEVSFRDDGKRTQERLDQAYHQFIEASESQRECPLCGQSLQETAVLPPRPQKSY